jgi:glycosyltransferase involved in cell wall biosynthesis
MKRMKNDILVSTIVSVYKAGRFIDGCLGDLTRQTIADRMEIIVVDSASDEGEGGIVRSYQEKYKNIIYLRTGERETVYAAWNRGIKLATGKYITNANTDDRHRKDALEVMVSALEKHTEVALVYADLLITETENQTFENCTPTGRFGWLDWDRRKLLEGHCFMGPQPMWRRSLHDEYGYFRSDFVTSGDYEFWLRVSQTHDFMHLPVVLGLYLKTPTSIEHSNRDAQTRENLAILSEYRSAAECGTIINRVRAQDVDSLMCQAIANLDQGNTEEAFHLARAGFLLEDPSVMTLSRMGQIIDAGIETAQSDALFETAIERFPHNKELLYQYIGILLSQERSEEALGFIEKSIIRFGHDDGILKHGLTVRKTIGPLTLHRKAHRRQQTSICIVLNNDPKDLAIRLQEVKKQADEIVAVDAGASRTTKQIAQLFGAKVYGLRDFPEQCDPWELAVQMAKGDRVARLDLY